MTTPIEKPIPAGAGLNRLSHSSREAVAIWWCSLATMAAILVIIALVKM